MDKLLVFESVGILIIIRFFESNAYFVECLYLEIIRVETTLVHETNDDFEMKYSGGNKCGVGIGHMFMLIESFLIVLNAFVTNRSS